MSGALRSDRKTQEERILWLLQSAWPEWVPSLALSKISLQYNARIFALRRKGFLITNRVKIVNGVKHGEFRLGLAPGTPKPAQSVKPTVSRALEGDYEHAAESDLLFPVPPREMEYPD